MRKKLFGTPERTLNKKAERALAAADRGDLGEAARLYEEVASEAKALYGPEDPVALTARGDVAATYLQMGELDRGRALLSELIPQMERSPTLGLDNRYTIHARLNLAAAYGDGGDHAQAQHMLREEVERAERVLGPDDDTTFEARESLAKADRALTEPELDELLALSVPQEGETANRAVAQSHRVRAAEALRNCRSYRSKLQMHFKDNAEEGSVEWLVEEAPEERVRVLQTIHSPTDGALHDLWVAIGNRRYQNAGIWLDLSEVSHEQRAESEPLGEALKLTVYSSFLLERDPIGMRIQDDSTGGYAVLEYASLPPALEAALPSEETWIAQTFVWLRLEDAMLAKVEMTARTQTGAQESHIQQTFSSFGKPIVISAPPSAIVPDTYEQD